MIGRAPKLPPAAACTKRGAPVENRRMGRTAAASTHGVGDGARTRIVDRRRRTPSSSDSAGYRRHGASGEGSLVFFARRYRCASAFQPTACTAIRKPTNA